MNYLNVYDVALSDDDLSEVSKKLVYFFEFESDMSFSEIASNIHSSTGEAVGDGFRGNMSSYDTFNIFDLLVLDLGDSSDRSGNTVSNLKNIFNLNEVNDSKVSGYDEKEKISDSQESMFLYTFEVSNEKEVKQLLNNLERRDFEVENEVEHIKFLERGASDWLVEVSVYLSVKVKNLESIGKRIINQAIEIDREKLKEEISYALDKSPITMGVKEIKEEENGGIIIVLEDRLNYYWAKCSDRTCRNGPFSEREIKTISKEDHKRLQDFQIYWLLILRITILVSR